MEENQEFTIKSSNKKVVNKHYNLKNQHEAAAVPDFIQKLFRMLENKAFKDVFCWDPTGTSFLVKDTNEFSKSILPKHFKHCNFASFVRQLNKYDFHKIRSTADENQKLYGDQTWEFEHSHFKRDRRDLLEEIKRKTPGKKKKLAVPSDMMPLDKQTPSPIISNRPSPAILHDDSNFISELQKLTESLQSQVNSLKQSHTELEATLHKMDKTDKLIMNELSEFGDNLKRKDEIIQECLKLNTIKEPEEVSIKMEDNTVVSTSAAAASTPASWTDQSTIPIESILTDLFLPTPSTAASSSHRIDTATVAAAAAQLNGNSLIGSSIKNSDGELTFLALGRLGAHMKDDTTATLKISNGPSPPPPQQQQQQQTDHVPEPVKGKKKMLESWTTPPRVLLVDDDSVYRDVSGRMLNMIGCSIDLAKDGLEALQKMSVEKYDLILMDIVMPKMDGIATTRNIRRYDSLTPIVSMTSNFTQSDIMEYIGIGMNDILPKPFSKNTLYDILEKHCAHLKTIQEQQQSSTQESPVAAVATPTPNYPYTPNTNSNMIVDTPSTPSSISSPTHPSPTANTTDANYWQPMDNRKLVWSSSVQQPQPRKYHHLSPPQPQQQKRQKLNEMYDNTPPY